MSTYLQKRYVFLTIFKNPTLLLGTYLFEEKHKDKIVFRESEVDFILKLSSFEIEVLWRKEINKLFIRHSVILYKSKKLGPRTRPSIGRFMLVDRA